MADGTAQQCGRVGSCHIYWALTFMSGLFFVHMSPQLTCRRRYKFIIQITWYCFDCFVFKGIEVICLKSSVFSESYWCKWSTVMNWKEFMFLMNWDYKLVTIVFFYWISIVVWFATNCTDWYESDLCVSFFKITMLLFRESLLIKLVSEWCLYYSM